MLDAIEDENTLVIFTTDHGLAFPGAKATLTDRGIGVLLIMRGPGGFTGGKVSDALVSQVDLFPTICDLIGIERPEWVRGSSLLPLVGKQAEEVNDAVFAEITFHAAYEPQRAVRTKRYKYIRRYERPVLANIDDSPSKDYLLAHGLAERDAPTEQLYDLVFDPNEANNLVDEEPEIAAELRERLHAWMEETGDPLLDGPIAPAPGTEYNTADQRSPSRADRRGPDGARDRPPDADRRARRAARPTGPPSAASRSRSSAPTAATPIRTRATPTSSSRSAPAPRPPAAGPTGSSEEIEWLRAADAAALPILGICFGAQALAAALGGCVRRLERPELGWVTVDTVDADRAPRRARGWPGTRTASRCRRSPTSSRRNAFGVQAFCHCRHLAVQFHPEVTPAIVSDWAVDDHGDLERAGHHARGAGRGHATASRPPPRGRRALFDGFAARAGLVAVASRV